MLSRRIFGIVRSIGDGKEAPTSTSFLQIYHLLLLYCLVSNALNSSNSNIDVQELLRLLTSYKECMLKVFKDNATAASKIREYRKDSLWKKTIVFFNQIHRKAGQS